MLDMVGHFHNFRLSVARAQLHEVLESGCGGVTSTSSRLISHVDSVRFTRRLGKPNIRAER